MAALAKSANEVRPDPIRQDREGRVPLPQRNCGDRQIARLLSKIKVVHGDLISDENNPALVMHGAFVGACILGNIAAGQDHQRRLPKVGRRPVATIRLRITLQRGREEGNHQARRAHPEAAQLHQVARDGRRLRGTRQRQEVARDRLLRSCQGHEPGRTEDALRHHQARPGRQPARHQGTRPAQEVGRDHGR